MDAKKDMKDMLASSNSVDGSSDGARRHSSGEGSSVTSNEQERGRNKVRQWRRAPNATVRFTQTQAPIAEEVSRERAAEAAILGERAKSERLAAEKTQFVNAKSPQKSRIKGRISQVEKRASQAVVAMSKPVLRAPALQMPKNLLLGGSGCRGLQ